MGNEGREYPLPRLQDVAILPRAGVGAIPGYRSKSADPGDVFGSVSTRSCTRSVLALRAQWLARFAGRMQTPE